MSDLFDKKQEHIYSPLTCSGYCYAICYSYELNVHNVSLYELRMKVLREVMINFW